jgi:hypothetical protein
MATAGASQATNQQQAVEDRINRELIMLLTYTVARWEEGLKGTTFSHYIHKDTSLKPNYTVYDFVCHSETSLSNDTKVRSERSPSCIIMEKNQKDSEAKGSALSRVK